MFKITIFHINDSHGRIKEDKNIISIDTIAAIKASEPNSLLVDAGDTLHGLPFITLNKGQDMINLMKLAGYDLMTVGNHDFNYGYNRLIELAKLAEQGENKFNIISANILKDKKTILKENKIKIINGVKIGFFGLTTPESAYKTNPNNVKGLEFIDLIEAAKEQVRILKKKGASIIIALAHVGIDKSSDVKSYMIAKEVKGIDIIIDGHSHSTLKHGCKSYNKTLIVSAKCYGEKVGKITLFVNRKNKVVFKNATLINKKKARKYGKVKEVTEAIENISKKQAIEFSEVVGKTLVNLNGAREDVRSKETNLGNLIADAMLYETKADISIINGGGIRASINKGEITKGEIFASLPFGSYIVTKYLSGEEIKELLEYGVRNYPAIAGAFPQVGGLSFVFDHSKKYGEKVVSISIKDKPIDMEKKYLVAINDFIAVCGDNYPCFGQDEIENEFNQIDEVLISYIQYLGDVDYSKLGRITVL